MTAAEKLKQQLEQDAPFTEEQLINEVCKQIKSFGRAYFYSHSRVCRTDISCYAIEPCYAQAAIDYASRAGFYCNFEYNSYGARKLVITL